MPLNVGDLLQNRYEIKGVLKGYRRSICSAVYHACDRHMDNKEVVIKALIPCPSEDAREEYGPVQK